jgi:hypothetical protein
MAKADLQKTILKGLLSLPSPILRAMSGGTVVYQGGRTLDPRFQFLTHGAKRLPSMTTLTPEQYSGSGHDVWSAGGRRAH